MAKKFEIIKDNILVITDTSTGIEDKVVPKSNVFFNIRELHLGNINLYDTSSVNERSALVYSCKLIDAVDETDTVFTELTFKTFAYDSLGFKTAPGSSGAILGNLEIVETDANGKFITASKNSAYNKSFGTTAGTVADGGEVKTGFDLKVDKTYLTPLARTQYVDIAGNDANDGSQFSPKRTIQAAHDALPSDTSYKDIIIGQGNFTGNTTISKDKVQIRGNATKGRSNTTFASNLTITGNQSTIEGLGFTGADGKLIITGTNPTLNLLSASSNSPTDVIDITVNGFCTFNDYDLSNKNIVLKGAGPVYITTCANSTFSIQNAGVFVFKTNSPAVTQSGTSPIGSVVLDFDIASPIAYSLLRQFTALGLPLNILVGTLVVNDDVGGTLQNLKCTTAYTIASAPGVGTPIDLTKYQVQTDNTKQNITRRTKVFSNELTNFTISQADIDNFEAFEFEQTTADIIITLSTPTSNIKKDIYFKNIGNVPINLIDIDSPIAEGKMSIASFNGTGWNIVAGGGGTTTLTPLQIVETDVSGALTTATKNTAYNKNYGTTADTVAQGNDVRFNAISGVPVGFCGFIFSNTIPVGYLELNGQTFNQAIYPELFVQNGNSNVLPDLRGLFLRGAGRNGDTVTFGNLAYENTLKGKQTWATLQHSHGDATADGTSGGRYGYSTVTDGVGNSALSYLSSSSSWNGISYVGPMITLVGSTATTVRNVSTIETRPMNIGVIYIIKATV